ncbi:MAG: hypothetical protein ACE14W_03465 [Candidatus Velamenicoccus archaeovorus]
MRVEYAGGARPDGLASMVGGLIEANLARHPDRARLLRPAVVDLSALDAGVSVSLAIETDRVVVAPTAGANGRPHVHVLANASDLLLLASAPLRLGLPDPLSTRGRAVLGGLVRRRIRIRGLLRHPGTLGRLSRLLSVV